MQVVMASGNMTPSRVWMCGLWIYVCLSAGAQAAPAPASAPATVTVTATAPGSADLCRRLCLSPEHQAARGECERGCRLFNIGMNTNWAADKGLDLNLTRDQCFQSCCEAYAETTRMHCFSGCAEMLNLQKDAWFYFEQRVSGENEGVLEVEVSLVSDPVLWEQTLGPNAAYKIPRTFIRTMPLVPEVNGGIDNRSWSPCVPPSNDLPRWFVATVAILLTLFTLYVTFTLPSRNDNLICDDIDADGRNRQMFDEYLCDGDEFRKEINLLYHSEDKKDRNIIVDLMTLNEVFNEDYQPIMNIIPPPKYTLLPPSSA